ncbi:MAG: aminotransferase class V-fold PLP-dependent enzyme, partial [Candidatus Izimaplasma sp.]|nr:aminotransferase class V-fold PLP-dependent enzyme [Candidatus Izimaplasma bacterium]
MDYLPNIKQDFPILNDDTFVYLDSAASSLTPQIVIDELNDYYQNYGVNVHRGVYNLSYIATEKYNKARQITADFIHCDFDEIVFTRGASNALNLVALSYGYHLLSPGDEIIVSELEHHSSVLPWQQVAKNVGAKLVYVPLTKEGRITVENFKKVLTDKTKIVALTYISNVLGYVTPLEEIINLAHQKDAIVSVDAAQAAPHILVDVKALDCDFLSFSGHKMLGPTGIGVLYGKRQLLETMPPLEYGGDMID